MTRKRLAYVKDNKNEEVPKRKLPALLKQGAFQAYLDFLLRSFSVSKRLRMRMK
ncbi:hypothetical protein PARA125_000957 [Parachlamydia sp. AcF125]|nr:hypothetical protein [Parachlamydia sp. AcF125]